MQAVKGAIGYALGLFTSGMVAAAATDSQSPSMLPLPPGHWYSDPFWRAFLGSASFALLAGLARYFREMRGKRNNAIAAAIETAGEALTHAPLPRGRASRTRARARRRKKTGTP